MGRGRICLICTCAVIMLMYIIMGNGNYLFTSTEPYGNHTPPINTRVKLDRYPRNGTGISVDISKDFDVTIFDSFCQLSGDLKAVLPIYSSVDKYQTRDDLRNSLGRWARKLNCRIFFVVGMSRDEETHTKLKQEYIMQRDILIVDKIDTYEDLNNKAAAMVEWISDHCMNVPYVIHLIDDAYVNLAGFLKRLESITEDNYILGTWTDTPTERRYWKYKSYVTFEEYPFPRFPVYAYGFAFAFPSSVAPRLRSAMYSATYCWIEDVWIAGHVRIKAGVKLIPLKKNEWAQTDILAKQAKGVPNILILHSINIDLLKKLYGFAL